VFAQRSNGPESIAILADSMMNPNRILPLHGGRLFFVSTAGVGGQTYEWAPTGFVTTSRFPAPTEFPFKGSMQSLKATHDGDSTALAIVTGASLQIAASALNGSVPTGTPVNVGNQITLTGDVTQLERRCSRFDYDTPTQAYVCGDSMDIALLRERTVVHTIPSPSFGLIAVAATRLQTRFVSEIAQDCQNASATPPSRCPKFTFEETPLSTRLIVLRRSDGTQLTDGTTNGVHLRLNTFTEDDTELSVEERGYVLPSAVEVIGVVGGNGWKTQVTVEPEAVTACTLVYYDRVSTGSPMPTRTTANPSVCTFSGGIAGFGRTPAGATVKNR
jgi:hypothetical protein